MAKFVVVGNILHVFMDVSGGDIRLAEEMNPENLSYFEEEDGVRNEKFRVKFDGMSADTLSKFGITFSGGALRNDDDSEGVVQSSVKLPSFMTKDEVADHIMYKYGPVLQYLNRIEAQIKNAILKYEDSVDEIRDSIEFVEVNAETEGDSNEGTPVETNQ